MLTSRRFAVVAIPVILLVAWASQASAGVSPPVNPPGWQSLIEKNQPSFAWQGSYQEVDVTFPSRATGATLFARLFAPRPAGTKWLPAVVILPGSVSATQSNYQWSAADLAGHGYVTVAVDPQGVGNSQTFGTAGCDPAAATPCPGVPYQQATNWLDAGESAIDYLSSDANPFRAITQLSHIGVAGHSLGARAASYLQMIDHRVKAVVAWDNLATTLEGDAGSPLGGGLLGSTDAGELPGANHPITPRVPSLGEASDLAPPTNPQGWMEPEIKKTAYDAWHAAGIPSMEIVWQGEGHDDPWVETAATANMRQQLLANSEYYTRTWFDLYLKGDPSAAGVLMAASVLGQNRNTLLSTRFHSATYIPSAGIDCPVLTQC